MIDLEDKSWDTKVLSMIDVTFTAIYGHGESIFGSLLPDDIDSKYGQLHDNRRDQINLHHRVLSDCNHVSTIST